MAEIDYRHDECPRCGDVKLIRSLACLKCSKMRGAARRKPREKCSVESCQLLVFARGWCEGHYNRWRRSGNHLPVAKEKICRLCGAVTGIITGGLCKTCTPIYYRTLLMKNQYGLEPGEYERVLEWQGGLCYICKKPPGAKRLAVDHVHKTGEIRGLLCQWCNRMIALGRDDATVLSKASEYLLAYPAPQALGRQPIGRTGRVTNKRKRRKRK